jgi:hypothetical protein
MRGIKERNSSWNMKKEPILMMRTHQMIPRYAFNKTFTGRFLSEVNWKMAMGPTEMED